MRGVEGVGNRVEGVRLVGACCVRLVGVVRTGTWRGEGVCCIQLAVVWHITACLVDPYSLEAFETRPAPSSSAVLQETSWDYAGLGVGKVPPFQLQAFLPFQLQAA